MFFYRHSTFILFIFFTYISFFVNGCKNISIHSQYSKKTINGEKLCIFVNIENHQSKIFANKLNDNPFASQRPNCDYFLIATMHHNDGDLTSVAGVRVEGQINMYASYVLYKYDATKEKRVQDILNNPLTRSYSEYTGSKNSSMSKASILDQETQLLAQDYAGIIRRYNNIVGRLNNVLIPIGSGAETESMSYLINVPIITAEEQNKYDVEEQLAKTLAEEIINDIAIDIAEYKERTHARLQQMEKKIATKTNTKTTAKKTNSKQIKKENNKTANSNGKK